VFISSNYTEIQHLYSWIYANGPMPDYSATLPGVMGISSGTYLGFKFPELQQQDST